VKKSILKIAIDIPFYDVFDYLWDNEDVCKQGLPKVGYLAKVSFGRREVIGMIIDTSYRSKLESEKLKHILNVRYQLPPLSVEWLALCRFAAGYYQRTMGEVVLPGLPKGLRSLNTIAMDKCLQRLKKHSFLRHTRMVDAIPLNFEQKEAVDYITSAKKFLPTLLYGITGSGKTEVYLQAIARIFEREENIAIDKLPQILILVPEINLIFQLEESIQTRFPGILIAILHSDLSENKRMHYWLTAHLGKAHIILGTRLSVLASIPNLKLIIVDEEHDISYKQQEGLRYSARDLAVWRAQQLNIPIVLGSATPSLETWSHAQSGHYKKIELRERAIKGATLPRVSRIDTKFDIPKEGLTSRLVKLLKKRLERDEQSLLFLNRRGYAPVIVCNACNWLSNCARCTSFMVFHKLEHRLRCHHCSLSIKLPDSCPVCRSVDLNPLGLGTQRLEEELKTVLPGASVIRIDADSTRQKGSTKAALDSIHKGEVDIMIGTQMIVKGHDFKNVTLIGILNPDTALFSHDYRASERLFAQLMQVSGRAGRHLQKKGGSISEVLIQTSYPQHPLYEAVFSHNHNQFATSLLEERAQACLPPYIYQALLRSESKGLESAVEFLNKAVSLIDCEEIVVHDPIPMTMTRIANIDRAQLLVECTSRPKLQDFLVCWIIKLRRIKTRTKWSLEVDPTYI